MSSELTEEKRKELIENHGYSENELTPYSNIEKIILWDKYKGKFQNPPNSSLDIDLENLVIHNFSFEYFIFPNKTSFKNSIFVENKSFKNSVFFEITNFNNSCFCNFTSFQHSVFKNDADFSGSKFCEPIDFTKVVFYGSANFYSSKFEGYADFSRCRFMSSDDFHNAYFKDESDFSNVIFDSFSLFQGSKFEENTYFNHSSFSNDAIFWNATFIMGAFFNNTVFKDYADFGCNSTKNSNDDDSKFRSITDFSYANFFGPADFTNRFFSDQTNFDHICFFTEAPNFAETTLHEATTWHNVQWPPTPTDPGEALRMADAYAHLRRRANSIQNHEAELDFFAREMRAKRAAVGGASGFLITLYEWSCNFGQSVSLPVFWLLGLLTGLPPVYHLLLQAAGMRGIDPVDLYGFSAASLGGFFGMRKEFVSAAFMERLPDLAVFLSGCQSVLGAALLFLIGLALRNRFRIK
jgi:hypothetical protein